MESLVTEIEKILTQLNEKDLIRILKFAKGVLMGKQ